MGNDERLKGEWLRVHGRSKLSLRALVSFFWLRTPVFSSLPVYLLTFFLLEKKASRYPIGEELPRLGKEQQAILGLQPSLLAEAENLLSHFFQKTPLRELLQYIEPGNPIGYVVRLTDTR